MLNRDRTNLEKVAREILARYLETGKVQAGAKLPSIRDLTTVLGASSSTVANALSILQAQGYVRKEHGVGCFVADVPEAASSDLTPPSIAFIMPTALSTGCLARIYAGVERSCRNLGYDLVTASAEYDYDAEEALVDRFAASGCQGIVMNAVTRTRRQLSNDYLRARHRDFPIVLVDIAYPEQQRPQVVFDNHRAGLEMTRLLLEKGHRRIAFMHAALPTGVEPLHRSTADRYQGYLQALQEAGVTPRAQDQWHAHLILEDHESEAEATLKAWLTQPARATAVVTLTDDVALDMVHGARALGIDLPRDLQITGFDNIRAARTIRPAFPTTDPDFERAGDAAVDLLSRLIAGDLAEPLTYMLPAPLVRTAIPARGEEPNDRRAGGGAEAPSALSEERR